MSLITVTVLLDNTHQQYKQKTIYCKLWAKDCQVSLQTFIVLSTSTSFSFILHSVFDMQKRYGSLNNLLPSKKKCWIKKKYKQS